MADELTPAQRKEVDALKAALEAEFAEKEASTSPKAAKEDIAGLKEDMLGALSHILNHSTDNSLRAKVAMWGYDKLIEEGKADADPLKKLLENMPAPKEESDARTA